MFRLDERLALCAEFVREGARLADVGTDHAYLPVWLACNGKIISAVACDVRVKPLENAKTNIYKYHAENIVSTALSDGLDNISPDLADDIVFAGMGGELIAKIIMRTQWLRDGNKRLILQPMSRADTLRLFLCENGFHIQQEKACISSDKSYSVMLCVYDGIKRNCSDIFKYTGLLENDNSQEAKRYIYVINDKLKKKLKGFDQNSDEYKKLYQTVSHLDILSEGVTL